MNSDRSQASAVVTSTVCLVLAVWCFSQPFAERTRDAESSPWRDDFGLFQQHAVKLAATGTTPSAESLAAEEDVFVITDGAGGLIDPSPEAGTVQFLLNREFNRQKIRWKVVLVIDSMTSIWNKALILFPYPVPDNSLTSEVSIDLKSMSIIGMYLHGFGESEDLELHAGDVLLVEATIGRGELASFANFSGVLSVQHLAEQAGPCFIVGLQDARITRLETVKLVEQ